MIQPQELRIGNYVEYRIQDELDDRKEWWELSTIDSTDLQILESGIDDDYRAIELTEEILLKFGFEKIKSDEYPHKFIINKDMRDEVEIENLNSQNCFVFSHGKKFSSIKIEYVHQLQNLYFSLTGKELAF